MAGGLTVTGSFAETIGPTIYTIFDRAYNEVESVYPELFNMETTDRPYNDTMSVVGLEPFQEFREAENIPVRKAREGFKTRIVQRKWGLGYAVTREFIDDNYYDIVNRYPEWLARSARATKESVAASIFNLGFSNTVLGGDGEPLFSTSHPMYGAGGGTQANTFATPRALSSAALQEAIIAMKRTVDDTGIFSPVQPAVLLVPDHLAFRAQEILGSPQVPYSADNTINVMANQNIRVIVWSYLDNTDNWFLLAPKNQTGLVIYQRDPMEHFMVDRPENETSAYFARERYGLGFTDWTGVWGVQGA